MLVRLFTVVLVCLVSNYGLFGQDGIIHYNQNTGFRLLFDYHHHNLPSTKVGNHIVTGSWLDSDGRYGWNDFVHTNTFDHLYTILSDEYAISMSRIAYNDKTLKDYNGVVIFAADNPALISDAKVISDQEIVVLTNFVKRGGSLMVMLNAVEKDRFNESFETKQVKKLLRGFGLTWNNDDTHYSDNVIPSGHSYFYDVPVFHYGAGCTLKVLPEAERAEILLDVYSDSTYQDRSVSGAGIVMVRPGKGKVILVGDAGSWTGNISRPWADNGRILTQLFRYMKPDRGVHPADYSIHRSLHYDVSVAGLQAVPGANSLSKINHTEYKLFMPRPTTQMPYFEATAALDISVQKDTFSNSFLSDISVHSFKWFDKSAENNEDQKISMRINRQGKISDVNTKGAYAQWLAPDIAILSALLPTDGLQPGDRWQSVESIRIPALRATDLPAVKMKELDIHYEKDILYEDTPCRLLVSSGEAWLSDWGITLEDILPEEEVKRVGKSNYRFLHERGGKILFKREQWVDKETGVVLEGRLQTRIITWIQDKRKPVGIRNLDKDNESIVSMANMTTFKLRR